MKTPRPLLSYIAISNHIGCRSIVIYFIKANEAAEKYFNQQIENNEKVSTERITSIQEAKTAQIKLIEEQTAAAKEQKELFRGYLLTNEQIPTFSSRNS